MENYKQKLENYRKEKHIWSHHIAKGRSDSHRAAAKHENQGRWG
jgi:hypothetical protein